MKTIISFTLLAMLVSLTGCSMLPHVESEQSLDEGEAASDPPASINDPRPHVRVEFHEEGEKPKLGILPVSDEPLFISDALKEVQARKRFSRFTAEVYRPGPKGYQRMAVQLDNRYRSVPPQYDYALHPNDRLIIMRDSSTSVDNLLTGRGPLKFLR